MKDAEREFSIFRYLCSRNPHRYVMIVEYFLESFFVHYRLWDTVDDKILGNEIIVVGSNRFEFGEREDAND